MRRPYGTIASLKLKIYEPSKDVPPTVTAKCSVQVYDIMLEDLPFSDPGCFLICSYAMGAVSKGLPLTTRVYCDSAQTF